MGPRYSSGDQLTGGGTTARKTLREWKIGVPCLDMLMCVHYTLSTRNLDARFMFRS